MHTHLHERRSHIRTFEMVETQSLRRRMEAAVETLIATLDALDGDSDFEPANDDEPSLGWSGVGRGAAGRDGGSAMDAGDDDREHDDSDEEDGGDRERDMCDDEDGGDLEECCEDEGAACDDEGDGEDLALIAPSSGPTCAVIDPSLMPDLYFMKGEGTCLAPIINDGDRCLISKHDPCRPGDYVAIYLSPRFVRPGGHRALLKRLVRDGRQDTCKLEDGRPAILVEMLNPPQKIAIPLEAVMAMHRLLRVDNDSPSHRLPQDAMRAGRAIAMTAAAYAKGQIR